jgi:hypothetical protein
MSLDIFAQYGLLGLVLAGIGYSVILIAKWAAPRIDKIIDSHTQFIDNTNATLQKMSVTFELMERRLGSIEREINKHE